MGVLNHSEMKAYSTVLQPYRPYRIEHLCRLGGTGLSDVVSANVYSQTCRDKRWAILVLFERVICEMTYESPGEYTVNAISRYMYLRYLVHARHEVVFRAIANC